MLLFCTYRHQRQFTKVNFPIKEYKNRTLILRMIHFCFLVMCLLLLLVGRFQPLTSVGKLSNLLYHEPTVNTVIYTEQEGCKFILSFYSKSIQLCLLIWFK